MKKNYSEDELKSLRLDEYLESIQDRVDIDISSRDRAMQDFIKNGAHNWTQRGIEISCTICPNHHGFYVTPDIILKGVDEKGQPILDKIS